MNPYVNPYITKNKVMSNLVGDSNVTGYVKDATRMASDYISMANLNQTNYGVYDNPLLTVNKPQAKPWRRVIREIEHALSSHDSRVWLNDKELTGRLSHEEVLKSLYGKKTVIIQISRNDCVVSRLYCTLGNQLFSLIGENRFYPDMPSSLRYFNFHEFIMKELRMNTVEARNICIDFIQGVTGISAT